MGISFDLTKGDVCANCAKVLGPGEPLYIGDDESGLVCETCYKIVRPPCPNCGEPLPKRPTRKRECPKCGKTLLVRGDGKYLFGTEVLTEEQAKEIDDLMWCQLFRFERRPIGHFYTRVAGVSFRNSDNTSRQRIIRELNPGERLELWIEPDNKHDKNAVAIKRLNGDQVGYVNGQLAPTIVLLNKHDVRFGPFVIGVREAAEDAPLGVLLAIVYTWGDQPENAEGRYIRGVVEPELQSADLEEIEHFDREANNLL